MAAALLHFTTSVSLPSHKPLPRLRHLHHDRRTNLLFTVSADRFALCAAAFRKPRDGKKRMSNVELCDEIKLFLDSTGLPQSHVPSVKELSLHGRNDLANLVRRRGYKLVGELLATSLKLEIDGFYRRKISMEKPVPVSGAEIEDNLSGILNDIGDGERGSTDAEFNVYESEVDIHGIQPNLHGYGKTSLAPNQIASPTELGHTLSKSREKNLTGGQLADADSKNNLIVEMNQLEIAEISHLKKMLPRKELELSRLEDLIEKEQLALSALQDKAEKELGNAKKVILDQDAELRAAEEFFSELVEVEIKYSGEGEMVELAGSFNGWDQRIQLDTEQSPESTETSPSRVWSTELWLYPGTYEIKFVVDGEWKIDPEKETITRGSITNNILRAEF